MFNRIMSTLLLAIVVLSGVKVHHVMTAEIPGMMQKINYKRGK